MGSLNPKTRRSYRDPSRSSPYRPPFLRRTPDHWGTPGARLGNGPPGGGRSNGSRCTPVRPGARRRRQRRCLGGRTHPPGRSPSTRCPGTGCGGSPAWQEDLPTPDAAKVTEQWLSAPTGPRPLARPGGVDPVQHPGSASGLVGPRRAAAWSGGSLQQARGSPRSGAFSTCTPSRRAADRNRPAK